ncbi:T9SS type B sorting domain-containing protein [Flavobacterium sp. ACN6]|uniref:T9SS type B sorting domain-containing protein n=1 Tax=Flavobacterium sp. ACN6 TaxID=1920426 RepID=UPI0015532466|nr:T9SS type B sorting domain-containing protein [Flavobacterium sp. ACN6]PBJ12757.1 Y_Y_Y domain protein [Flavobacterium sp. ACN6]
MEKPTIFKSVKTVFTSIKSIVSDTQKQFEKLAESFGNKPRIQPLLVKVKENRKSVFAFLLLMLFNTGYAQVGTDFSPRLNDGKGNTYLRVKGDVKLIGNTILTPDGERLPYNGNSDNNSLNAVYLNRDPDGGRNTSSSSANLNIDSECKEIVFAGLYWSAMYSSGHSTNANCFNCGTAVRSDWNEVRLKIPGKGYETIVADKNNPKEVIFKGDGSNNFNNSVYVCFKDVTDLLKPLKNAVNGTYTVGNIRATTGIRQGGSAGGWTLVVVYEAPDKPSKFISVFDGARMTNVDGGPNRLLQVDIPIKGFKTLPAPFNVYAKIGVAALDGDLSRKGDALAFRQGPYSGTATNYTTIWNTSNPEDNFFNASITENNANVTTRDPSSRNNLGFDIDYLDIPNDGNAVISNDQTEGTFRLLTTLAGGDGYAAFLSTFAVDIIEPKIVLTKVVKGVRKEGNADVEYDLAGQSVKLGQEMRYEIGFKNQGNDNAKDFTITDILPKNVIFNPATDIFPLQPGINFESYDAATRTLKFKVDNALVVKSGGTYSFKFRVRVISDCNELEDACSNVIKNTALSTYYGDENPTNNGLPYGDSSYSFNTGCIIGDPTSTNFLVGVDECRFNKEVSLCGSAILTAANGYNTYVWKNSAGVTVGTTRSITVTKADTYTVQTGGNPDCIGILQTYVVKDHIDGANVNPVSTYADNIVAGTNRPETCTRDNIEFPKIFLCGLNDTRFIDTKITSASSIVWQETKDVPPTGFPSSCPFNEATSWTNVTSGPSYTVTRPGAFRIVVTYGNNCVNTFYFSVFQNPLDPKADHTDITCNTVGSITVTNPPINTGYTYSLDSGNFQASNVFNNVSEGNHRVNIRQTPANGQTSTCPFFVDVTIIKETFTGTVEKTDPLCPGSKGEIRAFANGISGDYRFILKRAGTNTVVTNSGNITFPNYFDFINLNPGSYDVEIYGLKNNCFQKVTNVQILDKELKASVSTKPIACGDGEILISATGGTPLPGPTPSYNYIVNGVNIGSDPKIIVTRDNLPPNGEYIIVVADYAGCKFTIPTIKFEAPVKPTVVINQKNVRCYNSKEGEISITVTPANSGYAVSYNVNGGAFTTLPTTNLDPGTYKVIVKYTYSGTECLDDPKDIVIKGPTATLIASGGVAALSGCGIAPNENQGLVRITNVQGGVTFPAPTLYRYSFDGGKIWITDNQAYVDPSPLPYTLLVKDAADCIFSISGIILDPKPAKPTFNVPPAVYNCKGEGTTTVTANTSASANYTYSYYLGKPDPANPGSYIYTLNTNTPANIFKDIPAGDYKIKVEYNLVAASTFSNLLKEDFGIGANTKTPGIASAYCFHDLDLPSTCSNKAGTLEDNQYVVTRGLVPNNSAWYPFRDHTYNGTNTQARFLAINIGDAAGANGVLYSKVINDVIPNQPVIVEAYLANLFRADFVGSADPSFSFELVDSTGKIIAQQPPIPPTPNPTNIPAIPPILRSNKWELRTVSLDPGNNTSLTFRVRSGSTRYDGNDAGIDDITVYQLPKSCLQAEVLDLKVENGKGFTAEVKGITGVSCNGVNDGGFSIYAENFNTDGFYYTLNGGATSPTWVKATSSPVLISGRAAGTYDVRVRYADNATTCNFTIPTIVPNKDPFIVNASALAATCKGATVTANVTGGTPDYTITLKDKNSPYTKTFPASGILYEVPAGTYIISGIDSKSCTDAMDTELVINPAGRPTAEVIQNSGLCFNNTSAKITVKIDGGKGPYSYKVSTNGGVTYGNPSATFDGPTFDYVATATGKYDFLITDANSCDAIAVSQTINDNITASSSISGALTCTSGNATIEVTINGGTTPFKYVVKNKANNAVLFTSGTITGPKFTYTNVPGTYVFEITDKNNCKVVEEKEVKQLEPVTASHKVENVTCYNAGNGYIDITPLTGVGPFTYLFNGAATATSDTHYGNLAGTVAGRDYSYIVIDNLGCTETYTFKVFQPADLVPSASITIPYNCETNAVITASAVGGNTGGYTFVLKNTTTNTTIATNTTGVFNNLSTAGSYSVTVTDSKGCTKTVAVTGTIVALNPPKGMTIGNSAVTCPTNTATVTITNVVNAAGTAVSTTGLEYRIKAPTATAFQSGNTFAGLAAGVTYTFEVRDANKCLYEKIHEIKALPVFTVTEKSKTDVKCFGASDGTAIFTVSGLGNVVRYSYQVDALAVVTPLISPNTGSSLDISVTGLNAGNHKIRVTNLDTNCFVEQTVNIAAPAAALSLNVPTLTHVTCDNKGTATINAVGGWGTYTYVVTPPTGPAITQLSNNLFTNLANGNYTYTVTDINGCPVSGSFTINDKVPPVASIAATTDYCAGGAGATIRVTPNTAPNYVYTITGGSQQNDGTFSGLIPGNYVVTVLDTSTGCSINLASTTIASPVEGSVKLNKDLDCDPVNPNAIIEVTVKNGYPGYRYRVSTNGSPYTGAYTPIDASNIFTYTTTTGAAAAIYKFEILDSNNCRTEVTQNIAAKVLPDFNTVIEHVKCKGASTGSITVTGIPANGDYEYKIGTGAYQASNVFPGLGQGTYQVTIIDDKKCERTKSITVNEPAIALSATATATALKCGTNNAPQTSTITVTALNGTPFTGTNKYKYYYNGSTTFVYSNTYTTSTSGAVSIVVEDANGCTVNTSATVNTLNPPSAIAFSAPAITCAPANLNTDLLVTVTNGVQPLKYEITYTNAAIAPATTVATVSSNTYTFTDLYPGTYNIKVTDANGCIKTETHVIDNVVKIFASNSVVKPVSCINGNDGQIRFTVSGNTTGGYTNTLTGSVTGAITTGRTQVGDVITYTGLTAQTYTFVVTNTDTKCDATQIVTLTNPTAVTITAAAGTKVFCDRPDTTITVTATGGTGTIYYAVVRAGATAPSFPSDYNTTGVFVRSTTLPTPITSFEVYVQDKNGCPVQRTINVTRDAPPTIDPDLATCFTGTAEVTITGTVYNGNANALYGLNGVYDNNPVKTIPGSGTYILSVKDDNNCEAETTLIVNDQLKLKVTPTKDLTCTVVPPFTTTDAQVTLAGSGGNGTYSYGYSTSSIGPFSTLPGNIFTTSTVGTYYFNVTSDGCSTVSTVSFEVTTPVKPTASAVRTNPKCNNYSEGTITVTGYGGIPGYRYRINGGAWQDSPLFTDLPAAVTPGTTYNYQVIDTKGCISDSRDIILVEPDPIDVDRTIVGITCNVLNGVSLGSITIDEVKGGTGPYSYYVTGRNYYKEFKNVPGTSQVFEIVDFGLYELKIIDANDCPYIEEITITSPPEDLDITVTAPPPADCSALGSAIVAVGSKTTIPVGNGPFFFSYYTGVKPVYPTSGTWYPESTPLQAVIPGLIPGVRYTFIVYDSKSGCYYYETSEFAIPSNSTLTVGAPTAQNVTCTGSADGKVTFAISSSYGTPTPITYQVYDALTLAPLPINGSGTIPANSSLTISGFGAMAHGDYFVLVKEDTGATNAGCSVSTAMFSIRQSAVLLSAGYEIVKNDNCKTEAGIIRVSGKDGTGPYKYMVTTTAATPLATDAAWTTVPSFSKDSNNYYAWVKDANGCIQGTPAFLLPLDPSPAISLDILTYCAAEGAFQVEANLVTAGIAPYYISVNNSNFKEITITTTDSYTITGLNSGLVNVVLRDANGCETPVTSTTINATPIASAEVTRQLECSISGSVVENAQITVKVENGTTPYTYQVKKGTGTYTTITPVTTVVAGETTFVYTVAYGDADTYQFRISDVNACPIETTVVRVDAIVPITPSYTPTRPLCNGDNNGTILLSGTGGKGGYSYTLIRTAPTTGTLISQAVPLFENLIAGDYTYTIKDALGCEVSGNATLGQPDILEEIAPVIQGLKCTTGNDAVSATVTLAAVVGSGTAPYYYSFNGSDFSETVKTYTVDNTGADQTIPYVIKDANDCEVSGTVIINRLNPPTNFTMTPGPVITCTTLNTTINISAVQNGVGAFTYQIVSPASAAIDNGNVTLFTGLLPNIEYIFQVTDANGCTVQKSFTIDDVIKINIVEQSKTPITCLGTPDGKANFFVSGFGTGAGTYHYILDAGLAVGGLTSPEINLTNLAAGSHLITVYDDATGCEMPLSFTIAAPVTALVLNPLVVTPKGCTTFGGVTMTATGGWGDYTYSVTQPDLNVLSNKDGIFGNLIQEGTYTVSVTDANGCSIPDSFNLIAPVNPTATIAATSDYCYVNGGNTTTLVVTAATTSTFDVRPYQYSINNGGTWQLSDTFSNLSPGTYTILVKDKFGCKSTAFNTEIKGQLYATAEIEKPIYCVGALPENGIIRIKALGGYAPYRYTVTYNGVTTAPIAFTNALYSDYTVLSSANGVYVFNVYDDNDCHATKNTVDMVVPAAVTFTATPTSPYCAGGQGNMANGSILVELQPGNNDRNYTYTIQRTIPTLGAMTSQSTPLFTGLVAGTYTVRVISGKQCVDTKSIVITEPVLVEARADASPFTCAATNTLNSTVVTVTALGGVGNGVVGNYSYSENGTDWKGTNTFNVIDNQLPQTLTYYVRDANGCIDDVQITVAPFPKLTAATASLFERASCDNNGREIIRVAITGGATPANFEYEVYQDGQILQTATLVGAGNSSFDYIAPTAGHFYQFKIKDRTTLCSITTDAYEVPLYNTAKVIATASTSVSCNGLTDGELTIDVIDYRGHYTYQIFNANVAVTGASGSANSATVNPLTIPFGLGAGSAYMVVITQTDYPFCPVTSNIVEVEQPPILDITGLNPTVKNQNCNTAGAVITIDETQITGGSGEYKYVAVAATAGIPADALFKTEKIITIPTTAIAPAFDTWHVYVMDANGCKTFVPVNISKDPMPAITNVSVVSPCYDVAGYRINVTATGVAQLQYSLDGIQYQDDAFFIVKAPGDYTVRVRDANKCVVTAATAFNIPAPLTLKAEITKVPTCFAADGEITLTAGGGQVPGSYVYTRDNWATAPSIDNVFRNLAPGAYRFIVRDVLTNCEKFVDITIEDPTLVTGIVAAGFDASCKGSSDGRIEVTIAASNDNPVYMYSLSGPVNRPAQESAIFNDLPFGSYVVTVTSGRGCSNTAPATVGEPDAIVVDVPTFTQYICNTGNTAIDATITVPAGSVRGGSGSYIRYQFLRNGVEVQNDDRNVYVESDYLGGDYVINVFDNKGCQGSYATVTIDPYAGIADLELVTTEINCRDDESVQVTAVPINGALPTLTYTIEGTNSTIYPVTSSPTGLFAGLKPGTYLIKVTNPITGCGIERNYIVNEPNTFRFVASDIKDVTCFTDKNGSVTLTLVDDIPTPSDNAGPFTYVLTHESGTVVNGFTTSTTLELSNLAVGKYTITATLQGVPYCPVTTEFTIQGPTAALEITVSPKQITCESAANGEIVATAIGGWIGDYQYKLEGTVNKPYSAENKFTDLPAGSYTVYVMDANGCEDYVPVNLSLPTPITLAISADRTSLTCYSGTDATVSVNTINGGSGNFTYTLHGTLTDGTEIIREAQPTGIFTGLGAGTYYVTVSDDWTCTGTSNTVVIAQPDKVVATLSLKSRETCDTTPVITLSAEGGTAPYFYSTDGNTWNPVSFTTPQDFNVPKTTAAVSYRYYVRDVNGCTAEYVEMPLLPVPELVFEKFTHLDVPCKGGATGSIYVEAKGGLGNYVYTLINAATNTPVTPAPTQLTPGTFTRIPVGNYYVNVNSEDCDKLSALIEITEPPLDLSAEVTHTDVTCAGFNNGTITLVATGGAIDGTYSYAITPNLEQFFETPVFENLKPGDYTVRVQKGICIQDYPVTIEDAIPLVVTELVDQQIPEHCYDDKDGVAFVEVEGGKGPYTASISGNGVTLDFRAPDVTPEIFSFTGLLGGIEYTVIVKDANNCDQEVRITLPDPVKLNPVAQEAYDCENNLPVNSITVTVDDSIDQTRKDTIVYTLVLDGVPTDRVQTGDPVFKNLPTGNYSVRALLEGCEKESNVVHIQAVDPLSLIDLTNQSTEINTIKVKASGGVGPYEYSFNGEPFTSSDTYRIYKTDVYKVIVRDRNGCEATIDVPGTFYDFCMPNYFTPDGIGANNTIGPDCGALAYKDLTFDVYDRYGRVVGKYRVGGKWDGRYHGNELPTGDYWYVLKLNDPKDPREFVGHFTLYR